MVTSDALPTVVEILGAMAIGYGIWLIYPPAAYLWIGLACYGASFVLELRRRRPDMMRGDRIGSTRSSATHVTQREEG